MINQKSLLKFSNILETCLEIPRHTKQTQVEFTQHHLSGVIWETKYRLVRIVGS